MATVYKIEFELVSDWISYPDGKIKEILNGMIENWRHYEKNKGNDLQVHGFTVTRKA